MSGAAGAAGVSPGGARDLVSAAAESGAGDGAATAAGTHDLDGTGGGATNDTDSTNAGKGDGIAQVKKKMDLRGRKKK